MKEIYPVSVRKEQTMVNYTEMAAGNHRLLKIPSTESVLLPLSASQVEAFKRRRTIKHDLSKISDAAQIDPPKVYGVVGRQQSDQTLVKVIIAMNIIVTFIVVLFIWETKPMYK